MRKRRRLIDGSADIVSVQHALQEVQELTEAHVMKLARSSLFFFHHETPAWLTCL